MFGPVIDHTNQGFLNVVMMLGQKHLAGKTLSEAEALLYERACDCTARFAEARTLELEAAIRHHFPEARRGREDGA